MTGRQTSLPLTVVWFLLSVIGFFSHLTAIVNGGGFGEIALLSSVYFAPLLVESIEDFSKVRAGNNVQYVIDKVATLLGVAYLTILVVLVMLNFGGIILLNYIPEAARGGVVKALKVAVIITPGVFVFKKFYDFRMSWQRNGNVAKAYFRAPEKGR